MMSFKIILVPKTAANSVFSIILLLVATVEQVCCLNFSYRSFSNDLRDKFTFIGDSNLVLETLQVTNGLPGNFSANLSGRILYKQQMSLRRKSHGLSSFHSRFVFIIAPSDLPSGGLAFVLTRDVQIPDNSYGQWLGITNSSIDGSSGNNIVAFEFDSDDNQFGVDINSIKSVNYTSLTRFGINVSSGTPITAMIDYDGAKKMVNVTLMHNRNSEIQIISMPLDLSMYLPEDVYVGFSASTGMAPQLNCILEWYFSSSDFEKDDLNRLWVAIVISVVGSVICLSSIICVCYRKIRRKRKVLEGEDVTLDIESHCSKLGPKKYQFKELKAATNNFNCRNELGRGGFGIVYMGILNGKEVAIKRITKCSKQGKHTLIAEVTTIGGLHHKNLVQLQGWCYENNEPLLVYEFMPNKSLDKFIFHDGRQSKDQGGLMILQWEMRHNIICGVAQAIDYLHNECSKRVLHRDIKTSNVLLDAEFNACLGDFGLARSFKPEEKTHHTSKQISGTPGYMAPEIFLTGRSTAETDVFAFGVLMLEVACGRKLGIQKKDEDVQSIIDWVWEFYSLGVVTNAIDPKLNGEFNRNQAECMLILGLACCHPNPNMRPSMRTSLLVLTEELNLPEVPLEKPAFVWPAKAPASFSQAKDDCFSGGIMSSSAFNSAR